MQYVSEDVEKRSHAILFSRYSVQGTCGSKIYSKIVKCQTKTVLSGN